MGKFTKLRSNKKYGYTPRYYDDKGAGSPYKIEHKLDKFRSTVQTPKGLKGKFNNAMSDLRNQGDRNARVRFLVILLILLFIVLYIIDFDLSIFTFR
ncbi:riboflavin synthase subunit beta [Arenibacter sp. GZD96]|uniref:hypothetical protein n=1 Tax=Aurantibrevibacter litoralis TaxID=3106030 RepID=UPI002AFF97B1|nr:hypothetical protein [Arenibacter sp. GZD-96]MEA1785079.1 riboflavin synthase subunit beta [Arenibacter sp. GZD-96]